MSAPRHEITIPDPTGRTNESARVLIGDCIERLKGLPDGSVHTCITSPPYFGLRSYLPDDHPDKAKELGLEKTPRAFVDALVAVFREVHRVLRDDGTLWLNIGDSYSVKSTYNAARSMHTEAGWKQSGETPTTSCYERTCGIPAKNLLGIPWRVAFALQDEGWILRQDLIWSKPGPMPESVKDRCTRSHEYLFLFSKRPRYYFDNEAIREPARYDGPNGKQHSPYAQGFARRSRAEELSRRSRRNSFARETKSSHGNHGQKPQHRLERDDVDYSFHRNKRSVWSVSTKPYSGAHFAVFPPELIEPCVLAGCPACGVVLDPFGGSGTTAGVSLKHGRSAIVCELNAESVALMPDRIMDICRPEDAPTRVVNEAQVELFGSEVAP